MILALTALVIAAYFPEFDCRISWPEMPIFAYGAYVAIGIALGFKVSLGMVSISREDSRIIQVWGYLLGLAFMLAVTYGFD